MHVSPTVGFAGIHPPKSASILNPRTVEPIAHPRIAKREQVSRKRWHNEGRLASPDDVDAEAVGRLRDASTLG